MTKTWTQALAAMVFAFAVVVSTSVFAEDDVFVDEGDGDFDTMPVAPAAETKKTEPAPVAKQADPGPELTDEELATPTIVEEKTEAPSAPSEDIFGDEETSQPVVQETPKAPAKQVVEKVPAKKVEKKAAVAKKAEKKVAKSSKKGKGYFAWTADSCKLQRSPASTKAAGETAAEKKIWVEDYDKKFVKVWNKSGEAVFLSRDCLK